MQAGPIYTLLIALGAVAAIATGCGNDSSDKGRLLSAREAGNLQDALTRVQQDVAAKNCTAAKQEVTAFQQDVDSIRRLNRRLRSALRDSSRRLETLVSDKCQAAPVEPVQTETQTTPTAPTGATGPTGKAKDEKKPKPDKGPKDNPGQDGQLPPGQQDGGGGAGVPGESGGDGTASP